ncbi:MAG: histidinol-phosphate transaminase [Ktedonobacteraceae bacterium]
MTTHINERVVHGALDYNELERLGLYPEEILDFSVNANPYGPSPHIREAMANVVIDRYPDRACRALRQTLLTYEVSSLPLSREAIVCGNGASELIWTIARTYLKPGLKAAIVGPTFGEYHAASVATGATVLEFQAHLANAFQLENTTLSIWIMAEQPRLVWLCNPNNPTGTWRDRQQLAQIVTACQKVGALLVVDESYWRFVLPPVAYSALEFVPTTAESSVIVVRSLTKDFALAGIRLGYAVAAPSAVEQIEAQLPSWNVSGIAQAAGLAALEDREYLARTFYDLARERQAFFSALEASGRPMIASHTHFCLLDVGDASRVRHHLLMRNILVRDCTSFGLPQFIRVATRPEHDWQKLVAALKEVV